MGVTASCFATDFPHIECDWPNTRPFAERLFAGVPPRGVQDGGRQHAGVLHLEDTPVVRASWRAPTAAARA